MRTEHFNFMSQLSAMPAAGLARLPILVTGSWVKGGREVAFTHDDLRTAVANFQKLANHDINVDYDHACEDLERAGGEPTPSAGRIVALDEPEEFSLDDGRLSLAGENRQAKIDHRYILWGRYEPTDRARGLIKKREYRYVSAAFAKEYPDRKTGEGQGLTLTAWPLLINLFSTNCRKYGWQPPNGSLESGVGNPTPPSGNPNPNQQTAVRRGTEEEIKWRS